MSITRKNGNKTEELLEQIFGVVQNLLILQALEAGAKGEAIRGLLQIDRQRVTDVSKLLKKRRNESAGLVMSIEHKKGTPMRQMAKLEPIERVARSVDLLLKLKLQQLKGDRTQRDMILFLATLGISSGEIASLLGISRTI